jgi:hypothetical protein
MLLRLRKGPASVASLPRYRLRRVPKAADVACSNASLLPQTRKEPTSCKRPMSTSASMINVVTCDTDAACPQMAMSQCSMNEARCCGLSEYAGDKRGKDHADCFAGHSANGSCTGAKLGITNRRHYSRPFKLVFDQHDRHQISPAQEIEYRTVVFACAAQHNQRDDDRSGHNQPNCAPRSRSDVPLTASVITDIAARKGPRPLPLG